MSPSTRVHGRWQLRLAAAVLAEGGVVLHATEAVWGLACDPHNASAVARLLQIKRRAVGKGLLLIGGDSRDFAPEMAMLSPAQQEQLLTSWPGGNSWLLPNRQFPAWVSGDHSTVGVRVPGHAQARALCVEFGGPLVSSSANLSGRPAPRHRWHALRDMGQLVDHVLPGEVSGAAAPSQIRQLDGQRLR